MTATCCQRSVEDSEARTSTSSNSQISSGENGHPGSAPGDHASDVSPDAPLDAFGSDVSTESDELEPLPSSFALFAKTKFQLKTTHAYCCAALSQPLLAKSERADILVSSLSPSTSIFIPSCMPANQRKVYCQFPK